MAILNFIVRTKRIKCDIAILIAILKICAWLPFVKKYLEKNEGEKLNKAVGWFLDLRSRKWVR